MRKSAPRAKEITILRTIGMGIKDCRKIRANT